MLNVINNFRLYAETSIRGQYSIVVTFIQSQLRAGVFAF